MTDIQIEIIENIKDVHTNEVALNKLDFFLNELLRWNKKINLTSIVKYDESVEKHLIDSLYLGQYLRSQCAIVDMGSGAGLPSIPLAICRPDITVLSVDSVGKKVNFQNHIKRSLKLKNFTVVNARAEGLKDIIEHKKMDVITARAFTSLESLMAHALPVLNGGGLLLAMKGICEEEPLLSNHALITKKGFRLNSIESYNLPISLAQRKIIVLEKLPHH